MSLLTAHKILITFGIFFFSFFGVRELIHTPGTEGTVRFALAMVGAIALLIYLRWITKSYSKRN